MSTTFRTATLAICLCAPSAFGIVIRHDRDDARYLELAEHYRAPVAALSLGGLGTLIQPTWLATAAHVAEGINPFSYAEIGGQTIRIKSAYLHPSWTEGEGPRVDLALLELERPVQGVKPVRLYEKDDEVGRTVVFVGNGHTGDGNTGPVRADGLWRAAHNQVQEADAASLRFVFDRPPAGLDLEGISGPGDSGGPALIRVDEELYLLGTSGSNSAPRGDGHCTYETIESYGRVSTNMAWIRSALAGKEPAHGSFDVRLISEGWPEASGVEAARAFLAAHNTGDPAELVAVIERHTPESQVTAVPREERLERFRTRIEEFGKLEAIATALSSDGMLIVLSRGAKNERFLLLELSPREGKVRIGARDLPAQWWTELGSGLPTRRPK